ncbi:hypothetical protein K0M31_002716 [Melipona bicolor]|uniref:Uncharacterized protein n=1 Tax=Melipona bicolor TaxID=60889 RepID=A0AA40FZH7_9HYME|nr:hypothetical protein K0M31_002716 [Melipona bicolor]
MARAKRKDLASRQRQRERQRDKERERGEEEEEEEEDTEDRAEGTGCAGRAGMSKVAEDGRETYALLLARGRFLLRNRGTQPATMWWGCPRPSSSLEKFQEPCLKSE